MKKVKSSTSLNKDEILVNSEQDFYNTPITKYFKTIQSPQIPLLNNKQRPQKIFDKDLKNIYTTEKQILNGSETNQLSSISESENSYDSANREMHREKQRLSASVENMDKKTINYLTKITSNISNINTKENLKKLIIKQKSLNTLSAKKRKKNSDFNINNNDTTSITSYNRTSIKNIFKMSLSPIFKFQMANSVKENVLNKTKIKKRRSTDFEGKDIEYKDLIHKSILAFNKKYPDYFKTIFRFKIFGIIISFLSLISIFLAFEDLREYNKKSNNFFYSEMNKTTTKKNKLEILKIIMKRKISKNENTIRYLNGFVSILSSILVFIKYIAKIKIYEKIKNKHISSELNTKKLTDEQNLIYVFGGNEKFKSLIIKAIILIIFFPPYINYSIIIERNDTHIYMYSLNSLFALLNCLKIMAIFDSYLECSMYNSFSSKKICFARSIKLDRKFIIKSSFNRYPILTSIIIFLTFSIITAYLVYGYEGSIVDIKNNRNNTINGFSFFFDDLWLVSTIQLLRVYGEMIPFSVIGKYTLFFGGVCGFLSMCCFMNYINRLIELTTEEKKTYSTVLAVYNNENKENKAANVIMFFLFTKKAYGDYNNSVIKELDKVNDKNEEKILIKKYKGKLLCMKFIVFMKLYSDAKNFKNKYKLFRKTNINNLLKTYQNILRDYIINIDKRLDNLVDYDEKINKIKIKDKLISESISRLINQNVNLIDYFIAINNQLTHQKKLKLKKHYRQSLQIKLITQKIRLSQVIKKRHNKVSLPNIELVNKVSYNSNLKVIIDYFHNDQEEISMLKNKHNAKTHISRAKKGFRTFINKKKSGKSCDAKKLMNKTIIFGNKKFTIDSLFTNEKWVKPKHKKTSVIRRRVMFSLDKKSSE